MAVRKLEEFEKALRDFSKALEINLSDFPQEIRDVIESGQIQKFEMCFELFWKTAKEFLRDKEGIDVASPKRAIKTLFQLNYLTYEEYESAIEMLDSRNYLSHVYRRELVDLILPKLKEYYSLMEKILETFKNTEI
jgi:nucleotidyltransferase substrate binding protein (TIGR01987 family)